MAASEAVPVTRSLSGEAGLGALQTRTDTVEIQRIDIFHAGHTQLNLKAAAAFAGRGKFKFVQSRCIWKPIPVHKTPILGVISHGHDMNITTSGISFVKMSYHVTVTSHILSSCQ